MIPLHGDVLMTEEEEKEEEEEYEITEEDVKVPLIELVTGNKTRVEITDMADYHDVFYAIEYTIFQYWLSHPEIRDKDVYAVFKRLKKTFDKLEEDTLPSEIAKAVKAILIVKKERGQGMYSHGEILSCLMFLTQLARNHRSSDGIGYLKWTAVFFRGEMPETEEEIRQYIRENER